MDPVVPRGGGGKAGKGFRIGLFFFFFLVGFEDLKDWTEPNGKGS